MKKLLQNYCELHWWNGRKKTSQFKGTLKELAEKQSITYRRMKTETKGIYKYCFKNPYGVSFQRTGIEEDFPHLMKQFIQMELVRMGDPSQLYVQGVWRPTVTVNR